ncbi:MAG TPA: hypothetical protein VFL30_08925 [Rhodanobacteraceae bacterium]|nr:hypothetical protein [Rhodanobacteraceae bacterium]
MDPSNTRIRSMLRASWIAALAAIGLAGCSGSGGSDPSSANPPASGSDSGTLLISLTDADGDFVGYSVDVLSVTLQRRGGATVEVLPAATRIDFAQLTELSDLLAVATLAPGDIVGGKIRLDYGNAEVSVLSGGQVAKAKVIGADGAPLGVTELDIRLPERQHLIISRGRAALLSLDFDLAASHEVDMAQSPPVVKARPYIVAEIDPLAEKDLRMRGALVSADVAGSSYTVDVRPWFLPNGAHGRVTVHTTASTSFEIDGVPSTGAAGLTALAAKPAGTMTVAFGTLSRLEHRFTAEIVHAGDSVGGERIDAVQGNIVSRNGNRLTVKGGFAVNRDHVMRVLRTVVVDVGANTKVLKTGAPGAVLDASALSVGQQIVAFGTLAASAIDTTPATFDATSGRIRMMPTNLRGAVNAVVPGQLNLNLRGIDRLGIDAFDFTGTGVTPAQDANPADYEVATGTLGLASVAAGEAASVVGFVRPFGGAPPDFEGRTVIDHRELPTVLGIGWGMSGTTAPFSSMGATGLVLDLGNPSIGTRHHMVVGGMRVVDLTTLAMPPTLAPTPDGRAVYGISVGADIRLYDSFAEFSSELASKLGGGGHAIALTASGRYEAGNATLYANHIAVHFAPN